SFSDGTPPDTVTIAADATTATYTVATQIVGGTGTGTITATVDDGGAAYTLGTSTSDTVTILDSSTRTISVSGPADAVTEADNARAEFIVTLSSRPDATAHTVTVNYDTASAASNPATVGDDYMIASGTLTFAGSETSKTVTVAIINDTAYENPDEQFQLALSDPQPAGGQQDNRLGTGMHAVSIVDDEQLALSIAPVADKASVTEAPGATLAYEVTFTGATQVQNDLAIHYAVDSTGTATSGGSAAEGKNDYTAPSGSLTFVASDGTSQTVLVTVLDDDIVEDAETVVLRLGVPSEPRVSLSLDAGATTATGTITDDETPTLSIRAEASSVTEGADAVFIITSSNSPMDETVVGIAGTETGDFVTGDTLPTMVTLAASESTATLTVATTDDTADELNGSLAMGIDFDNTTPSRYTAGSVTVATVILEDNDDPPTLTVSSPSVEEAEGAHLMFVATLAPASDKTATVDYATSNGTATAPGDYTAIVNGSLTFLPRETTKQVLVTVKDDDIVESDETLTLRFNNSDNINEAGFTGGNLDATGTITDNEMPTLSISASAGSVTEGGNAVFTITSTNSPMHDTDIGVTATEPDGFVPKPLPTMVTLVAGETTATLNIATIDDETDEADGSLEVQLNIGIGLSNYTVASAAASATVTIKDDDGPAILVTDASADEPDGQLVFTVALDLTPVEQTEVMWETANDTTGTSPATAGADYTAASGKLTFAAGTTTLSLNVTVSITNDDEVEPLETFLLTLSAPTNEATFAAGASAVTVTGTITSDDVTFVSVDNDSANENENLEFTVTLSPVSYLTVVVSYATTDGTAEEGSDYAISNGMLTFMPRVSSRTITVLVTDDDITEGEEDLTLTLSGATHATIFAGSTSVTGTITDNEMPGLSIRASDSSVTEGTPAVFIITSSNSPMDDTEIGVAASETDGFVDSNTLPTIVTLAADETSATLTVATMGDSTDEADGRLT
ncbi:MAG: Calx-beta domain-containing protein, partial [Pseudohongiellaceae bacterium]